MRMPSEFEHSVWKLLRKIPPGKVASYKQIAVALGKQNAARAVGNACSRNPNAPGVPCHRVVCSDGKIGGYRGGTKKKIELLGKEGIIVKDGKISDFEQLQIQIAFRNQ